MLDWAIKIIGLVPFAADALVPGLKREIENRVTCSALFHDIRQNHHLKRALRLSWISAAQAIVNACKADAGKAPDVPLYRDFERFLPVFDAAMQEARRAACDLSSKRDLPSSPIDDFIYHFVESMPEHVALGGRSEGKAHVTDRFLADLRQMTCAPDDLPQVVQSKARAGVARGDAAPRDFGTLMFDDFARILQDPDAYPEARASFEQIQYHVHKELSRESLRLSGRIAELVQGIDAKLDQAMAPPDWLSPALDARFSKISHEIGGVGIQILKLGDAFDTKAEEDRRRHDELMKEFRRSGAPDLSDLVSSFDPMNVLLDDQSKRIFYCLPDGDTTRFDEVQNIFHRVKDNLKPDDHLDLLPWYVPYIELREQKSDGYFRNSVLSKFGSHHSASIIELGADLGSSIECGQHFCDRLDNAGWHADDGAGVDIDLGDGPNPRRKASARGAFPLTIETRLALSTLLDDKDLRILLRTDRSAVSKPAECFLAFMETLGVPVEEAGVLQIGSPWVLRYLQKLLGITATYVENPYPRLEHFTVETGHYFGREDERDAALTALADRRAAGLPAVLGVRGSSGCGKSSFVQARLVTELIATGSIGIALRRTDMLDDRGEAVIAAERLCDCLRDALGRSAVDAAVLYQGPPRFVVPSCCHHLDGLLSAAGDPQLVVCLDQFEEIVDDLADEKFVAEWRSLLGVLDHLATKPNVTIIYTLEDSRFDRLASAVDGSVLCEPAWLKLEDSDPGFLRTVVVDPFREAGFELDETIVTQLVDEAIRLDRTDGGVGSPLPLLSLKLHNLFREIRAQGMDGDPDAPVPIDASTLSGVSLSIAAEIEALAEEAWSRSGASDDDLEHFLRPLVRLSQSDAEGARTNIVLGTIGSREFATERKVESAFVKARILVPAAGGLRLVHESVIHRWQRAARWFAETRDELAKEDALRVEAESWHARGRPPITRARPEDLETAVLILGAQLRSWATDQPVKLPAAELRLRDYACALFDLSETPLAAVPSSKKGSLHVHLAAAYGRVDLLRRFAELDPESINAPTATGQRPLHNASFSQAASVKTLLDLGAEVGAVNTDSATALGIATFVQRSDIVDLLLPAVAPAEDGTLPGNPLIMAALVGDLDLARKLEAKGYSHDTPGKDGWTPLHSAAVNNNVEVFRYFLARGDIGRENKSFLTPLDVAASNGNMELIHAAIAREEVGEVLAGTRSNGWTTLIAAAFFKKYKTVEMLVPLCDPNITISAPGYSQGFSQGFTALHFALYSYDADRENASRHLRQVTARTAEALLSSAKTDVLIRAKDRSAFDMAQGLPALQELILAHPTFDPLRPMAKGWTELMYAADSGNRGRVEMLFDRVRDRTNIDHVSEDGKSLALLLLQNGMADLVTPMIERKEVDPWKAVGKYPGLLVAADSDATRDLYRLISKAMPDRIAPAVAARILDAITARSAVGAQDAEIAQGVLDRAEAPKNASEFSGAMIQAGRLGRIDIFDLLESHGVTPGAPDEWGRGIADLASESVRAALLRRGGYPLWTPERTATLHDSKSDARPQKTPAVAGSLTTALREGNIEICRRRFAGMTAEELRRTDDWGRRFEDLVPDIVQEAIARLRLDAIAAAERKQDA